MTSTKRAGHNDTGVEFSSDVEELKENFKQLRSDVTNLVGSAIGVGQSGMGAVRDKAADTVKGLKDKGSRSLDALEKIIAERPLRSAMIALAAGFILAKLLRRR